MSTSRDADEAAGNAAEEIEATAPTLPWEILLPNSATFFQRLPNGGMLLKFTPAVFGPQGGQIVPPGIVISFSADGWERFKEEVARDGVKPPEIPIARTLPKMMIPQK
jgi:hypothetical protein